MIRIWSEIQNDMMVLFLEKDGLPFNCAFTPDFESRSQIELELNCAISALLCQAYCSPTVKQVAEGKVQELEAELAAARSVLTNLS